MQSKVKYILPLLTKMKLQIKIKKISRYFLFINLYYRVKFSFKQTCFWDEVKKPLLASIHKTFLNQELSTSQKQAVMKMLGKKDKDKRFIKNWRSISLLNTDMKIISKVLSTKIKGVLPYIPIITYYIPVLPNLF